MNRKIPVMHTNDFTQSIIVFCMNFSRMQFFAEENVIVVSGPFLLCGQYLITQNFILQ